MDDMVRSFSLRIRGESSICSLSVRMSATRCKFSIFSLSFRRTRRWVGPSRRTRSASRSSSRQSPVLSSEPATVHCHRSRTLS